MNFYKKRYIFFTQFLLLFSIIQMLFVNCSGGGFSSTKEVTHLDNNSSTDNSSAGETNNPPPAPGGSQNNPPPQNNLQSITTFETNSVYSRTIYISSSAPSGGDGSQALPYQTISRSMLIPGNDIILLPGDYSFPDSLFVNIQGTGNQPIKIRGAGNAADVRINGLNQQSNALRISDVRYFILENLTLINSYYHGINIDDGGSYDTPTEYVVFRNLIFSNIGRVAAQGSGNLDCLKISGVNNFWILNSSFNNCKYQGDTSVRTDDANGELIDMVGCHNGVIAGNIFSSVLYNGVQTKGGSSDILVTGNTFRNIELRSINIGGNTDPNLVRPIDANYEARNVKVIGNHFENSGWATAVFEACVSCLFSNNTVINPVGRLFYMLNTTRNSIVYQTTAPLVHNNIVYFNSTQLSSIVALPGPANLVPNATGSVLSHNLFYASNNPSNTYSGPAINFFQTVQNNLMQTNPLFNTGLYSLSPNSPARGYGLNIYSLFEGYYFNNRRIEGAIDLGAY